MNTIRLNTVAENNMVVKGGAGGGSGTGMVTHVVFYLGPLNEDLTGYILTSEQQAHNAEMFKILKESPVALSASLDMSFSGDGAKVNVNMVKEIWFVSSEVAEKKGLPSACVMLATETGAMLVYEDGSVARAE